jgi:hypothetical protein
MQEQRTKPELFADFRCLECFAIEPETDTVDFVLLVPNRLDTYALPV